MAVQKRPARGTSEQRIKQPRFSILQFTH
uniref:Uncharacterized protein n=1 Tax=Anguilla anguilla TaxID=7936 RepID=A0A0E9R8M4_ANGAN